MQQPALQNVHCNPNQVAPGGRSRGSVFLSSVAPKDMVLRLRGDLEQVSLPSRLRMRKGKSSAEFEITVSADALPGESIDITASYKGDSITTTLDILGVQQPALQNVHCDPNQVAPGGRSRGSLFLSGVAPESMVVRLRGDPERLVSLPSTVQVEEGESSAEFEITVSADALPGESIDITASYRGDSITTRLEVP